MALDALVDSAQLDSDLTSVADAIREKGGTSAQLAFPTEFVSAIEAISGGGGGGNTWKLLASGTYVKTSGTYLTIPVTYTGTPQFAFVCVDTPLSATAQCVACVRGFGSPFSEMKADYDAYMKNGSTVGYMYYFGRNSSDTINGAGVGGNSSNLGQFSVSASQISFAKISNTYPWASNTYHWYIYGEEAST